MFKRLFWSGSRAKFWGVTWDGDDGMFDGRLNYHGNVANAFSAASNFCGCVEGATGAKIVLAHSLGNMVVSSAIQDYGLAVDKYFMLNAAVASECYDSTAFNDSPADNPMFHDAWAGYNSNTWCSTWSRLFTAPDGRSSQTWKNRFPNVLPVAYNYYSSGDEIFELKPDTPTAFSGTLFHLERYAWQKQESFKGRGIPGGTSWAGWGFDTVQVGEDLIRRYTAAEANAALPDALRTNAVFSHFPAEMFQPDIPPATVNEILAKGVPALSGAAGRTVFSEELMDGFDMNTDGKPDNGAWGRDDDDYGKRCLHSDICKMAFFYTYKLFTDLVEKGDLK